MVRVFSKCRHKPPSKLQLDHVLSDMVSGTGDFFGMANFPHASIGPCPFRHGKGEYGLARSFLPRKLQLDHVLSDMVSTCLNPNRRSSCMLQLDHVLSDMVSSRTYRYGWILRTLQLDHVLSDMVRRVEIPDIVKRRIASIGPCPFRHGKFGDGAGLPGLPGASIGPCPFRHGKSARSPMSGHSPTLQLDHVLSDMVS